jgi:hypothetical protein
MTWVMKVNSEKLIYFPLDKTAGAKFGTNATTHDIQPK